MLFSALRRRRSARNLTITMALIAGTAALTPATPAAAISPDIVISQVYGGGGNSGATLTNDFIELFNRGTSAVNIAGWSVQYASSAGTTWSKTDLSGTVEPGQYYLVQQAIGSSGTTPLPTPDAIGTLAMSATAGKVALANTAALLAGACPTGGAIVDFVGYGAANCSEGSPTPTLSNTTDAIRLNNGCTDTDNNAADFVVGTPNPRNSASPLAPCVVTPTNPTGTGAANPDPVTAGNATVLTVAVTAGTNPASTGLAVSADLTQIGGAAAQAFFDDGTNGDVAPGDLTFSWSATVAPATPVGAKSLPASITDAQSRSGSATINVTVQAPVVGGAAVAISQVYGGGGNSGATFTHDFIELYNRSAAPVNITGWSVQYAGATGTSWTPTALSGTLQPGQYYLVQQAAGAGGTTALPTPDATGNIAMSGTAGKVALVNTTTALTGACPTGTPIVDFVGYGTAANCSEGSPTPTLTNTTAAIRSGGGATDTNNNSADFVTGAPNPRNTSFGIDFAPSVSATTPANGASSVAVTTDVAITFNEPVNVAGSWFTILCTASGSHTATVAGGPTAFTLDPDTDFANGESCTVTVLAAQVTDVDTMDPPDNMAADFSFTFETVAADPCSLGFTPVYAIQGNGAASPLASSTVSTKGVVVGDFQGTAGHNGFYVQDADGDADPLTSDGIFVFVPAANPLSSIDVSVGDVVRVSGRVIEFNTLTEIDTVTAITPCGTTTSLAPTPVSLPETVNGDLERYEGMLITLDQTLTATQNFFQGRFGQVSLSSGGRQYTPTNVFAPGSPDAIALADENARRLLVLDDGTTLQNPNPIPYIGADSTLRAGDTVTGLTGVLDYGPITAATGALTVRDYRLQPTVVPTFARVNDRTAAPAPVGGDVKVAAFNVLNYFNGNGLGGGYPTPRGANNAAEFTRQRDKIIAAITAIDADVVGLMEIENDAAPNSAIEDLVAGLNAVTAAGTYAFINTGVVGTDEIRVGVIYQPAAVTPVGAHKVLTSAVNPLFDDTRSRPAVAQTFAENASGAKFTVAVNHLKSKGSTCAGDPDTGDGQGNCNQTRVNAATAITQWLATDPTGSGDPDFMIIGDLNAYAQEDPITAIKGAGYTNLIESFMGPSAYSFTFDGASGYLDHALATAGLAGQVTGVTEWHINADEPSVIDYNTEFKPQDLYTPTPYRSSDHDPVVIGLALNAPPTVNAGGPYMVAEGGSVGLAATGSDPEGGTLTYAWDLDDNGTFETAGQSVTFSAAGLDGPGSATVTVRVTDPGGLTAVSQATVNITNVAPTVATPVTSPSPSTLGQAITASATFTDPGPADAPFTCTVDYGSGPQSGTVAGNTCTGPSHVYSTGGSQPVTVAVTDKDGGVGSNSVTHVVRFAFDGFYAPIANAPALNQIKAGQSIPVKFRLGGDQGLDVLAAGFPKSHPVACVAAGAVSDPLEMPASLGGAGLSYDPLTQTYNYVWKTSKSWSGTCRELVVKFIDGTQQTAIFSFK